MSGQPSPEWLPTGHVPDTDDAEQPRSVSRSLSPAGEALQAELTSSTQKRPRDDDSDSVEEGEASESGEVDESPSRPSKRQRTKAGDSQSDDESADEGEVSDTSPESGESASEGEVVDVVGAVNSEESAPEKGALGWNSAVNKGATTLRTSFGSSASKLKATTTSQNSQPPTTNPSKPGQRDIRSFFVSSPSGSGSQEEATSSSETKANLDSKQAQTGSVTASNMPVLRSGTDTQAPQEEQHMSMTLRSGTETWTDANKDQGQKDKTKDAAKDKKKDKKKEKKKAGSTAGTPVFYHKKNLDWYLPVLGEPEDKNNLSAWTATVEKWCHAFCAHELNTPQISKLTDQIILRAFNFCIHHAGPGNLRENIEKASKGINTLEKEGKLATIAKKARAKSSQGATNSSSSVNASNSKPAKTEQPAKAAQPAKDTASVKEEPTASEWASLLDDPPPHKAEQNPSQSTAGDKTMPDTTPNQAKADEVNPDQVKLERAPNGDIIMDLRDAIGSEHYQISRDDEVAALRLYFPGVPEKSEFCVFCHATGHRANDCPDASPHCTFCPSKSHTRFQCPDRQRCDKCRQLGHAKAQCKEKLKLSASEMECAFCASRTHGEGDCPLVWRTYYPSASGDSCSKVQSIPSYCYCCGAEGHFGADCPDNKGRHVSGRSYLIADDDVWSASAWARYVDAAAAEQRIAWVPPLPPGVPPVPQATDPIQLPNIPGRSIVPRTHIHFTEDDDDDDVDAAAFLNHAKRPARGGRGGGGSGATGNIRFSDLYQGGGRRGGGNGGNNQGSGGASSLPPRPPQAVRMGAYSFRAPAQNDHGGRGGGGGGGGGRGRGGAGGGPSRGGGRGGSKRGGRGRRGRG